MHPLFGRLPFDLNVSEPELSLSFDDPGITQFLLKYHETLLPSLSEQQTLANIVKHLCDVVDNLIVNPVGNLAKQIEEVRSVGSFKLGTLLAGHNTADVVIVTRILPTDEIIKGIRAHVEPHLSELGLCTTSLEYYGFSVKFDAALVRVFVTTTPNNLARSKAGIHVNPVSQKASLNAIWQARWSEEYVTHTTTKMLIRILKDFRKRFKAFRCLSSWMITLLSVHAAMQYPSFPPLTLHQAFLRTLQLMASGIFLPGSPGVLDPCEPGPVPLHYCMSPEEQDELCCTAQTLLRSFLIGAREILFTFDEFVEGNTQAKFVEQVTKETGLSFCWSEPVATKSAAKITKENAPAVPVVD